MVGTNEIARDLVQSILYSAVVALPRVTISTDEVARMKSFAQISLLYKMLSEQACELSVIQMSLPNHIKDAVISTMQADAKLKVQEGSSNILPQGELLKISASNSTEFGDLILTSSSQKHTLDQISRLLKDISSLPDYVSFAKNLMAVLPNCGGNERIAICWIILQMLRNTTEFDQGRFVSFGDEDGFEDLLEQFYSYSLNVLSEDEQDNNWKLQTVALEAVAMSATYHGETFATNWSTVYIPLSNLWDPQTHLFKIMQ